MKIGRNEQCWCGSGKKYKKCHLNRELDDPVQPWEASAKTRKVFSVRLCSAPSAMHAECSGQIVRAHTVPKSGSLGKIATNGHVYAFAPTLEKLIKHKGKLKADLVGVNHASTFTGFCSVHDTKLFSPLELHDFTASQKQCFLLAYRAYAREIYTKKAAAESAKNHSQMDRGHPIEKQVMVQSFSTAYNVGLNAALKDIAHHQPRFEAPLLSDDFSLVRAYVITFDIPPPVMCSGAFGPEQDFDGKVLQDLNDLSKVPSIISITSFFGGQHGHFVLVWMPDDDEVCVPFAKSLAAIPDTELSSALVRFMFEFVENVQISPAWWNSLSQPHQTALETRMASSATPTLGRRPGCLKPDNWLVAPWPIREREWIGIVP